MNKIVKQLLLSATTALMLTACSSDEEAIDTANERVAVEFSASVGVTQTRAIDQTWSPNDAIGIFMVNTDNNNNNNLIAENISENAENIRYIWDETTTNGFKADGAAIYYPMNGGFVDFYAYYPQGNVTKTADNYGYALNVADQSNQEAIDFMYSNNVKGRSKTSKEVALSFAHQLCKVILTVQPGDGVGDGDLEKLTVTVTQQNTTATFNLTAGTVQGASTAADITLKKQDGVYVYEAILLPNTDAARIFKFNLNLNNSTNTTFTWNMGKALVGGSKYIYTVKLNRSGVAVTGSIASWTEIEEKDPVDAN